MSRKQYRTHKFNTYEECIAEISKENKTRDDVLLMKLINKVIQYLDAHNINADQYEDIIELFKNSGFTSPMIINMMKEFKNYIIKCKANKIVIPSIDWLSNRSFKIAKFPAKNIILNRIIHEYPDCFVSFLKEYMPGNVNFNIGFFFNELDIKIKRIHSISYIAPINIQNTNVITVPEDPNIDLSFNYNNDNDEEDEYFADNEIHQILQY